MTGKTTTFNFAEDKIELTLLNEPMELGLVGMVSSELFAENIAIVVEDNPQTVDYDFACLGYTKTTLLLGHSFRFRRCHPLHSMYVEG